MNIINCFEGDVWSPMIVIGNDGDTIRQIIVSSESNIYIRAKQSNEWQSWVKIQ